MIRILLFLFLFGFVIFLIGKKKRDFKRLIDIKIERVEKEKNILEANYAEHRSMNEVLQRKLDKYSALKEMTQALSSYLSINKVVELIVQHTFDAVGKSDSCLLFLVDEEKQTLVLKGSINADESEGQNLLNLFDNWVLKQRHPLLVGDTKNDFRFRIDGLAEMPNRVRSLISTPLITEKKILGILRMNNFAPEIYLPDDLRLLNIVADLAALSVRNAQLYQEREELAVRDGLTELYVQRYFKEHLLEELDKALKLNLPCSVFMLDIDQFKNYNDRYGHVAGDIVLVHIAKILNSLSKPEYIIARYGGEEFAMILPGVDKDEALSIAERIREGVEFAPLFLRREETRVTISIGVVSFPGDSIEKEGVLRKADIALYKAKEGGRNKVCSI